MFTTIRMFVNRLNCLLGRSVVAKSKYIPPLSDPYSRKIRKHRNQQTSLKSAQQKWPDIPYDGVSKYRKKRAEAAAAAAAAANAKNRSINKCPISRTWRAVFRPSGPALCQPRATPWEIIPRDDFQPQRGGTTFWADHGESV